MPAAAAETALEQTFSDLANARLRDKCPALLDYLVGFQMIDSNEDGSKAAGIFGCEIGDSWHYITTFFLNGEVKGLDSIYSVDSDLFIPLEEGWVDSIINRRPNSLGKVDTKSRTERGVRYPNYARLRQIPMGGMAKSSSVVEAMTAQREYADLVSLPDALNHMGSAVADGFVADIQRFPKLAQAVAQFYDLAEFGAQTKVAEAKASDIVIISSVAQPGADKLSDAEKQTLVSGGVAIVDKRPDESKSITYRTETHQVLQSPAGGGLYDILMADGSIEQLLVCPINGSDGKAFVYNPEDEHVGVVELKSLQSLRAYPPDEFRKVLEAQTVDPDKTRANDCVVFIALTGEATVAYEVKERSGSDKDSVTTLKVRTHWIPAASCGLLSYGWSRRDVGDVPNILVSDAGPACIRYGHNVLPINSKRFRALIVNRVQTGKDSYHGTKLDRDYNEITYVAGDFGDVGTIQRTLSKIAAPLKVWRNSDDLNIKDQHGTQVLGKVASLGYLMRVHGMTAEDATTVVTGAKEYSTTSYRVKYAASLLPIPDTQDETDGSEMSAFHKTQVPGHGVEKAESEDNRPYYQYQSPFAGGDDGESAEQGGTMKSVERAAETGQKDVFDASVLSSLIDSHNPTELVDRFLPTLVSAMDRLGRLLFLLHWHFEEFQERYGKSELSHFADDLKSTFEAIGDLVLFMRKRTLAGDPEFYGLNSGNIDG
jgi:hypothetical protein